MKGIAKKMVLTMLMVLTFAGLGEARKKNNNKKSDFENPFNISASTASPWIGGDRKFVLEGYVADDILDSCYNVYIAKGLDDRINDSDIVACVQVKNKRFRFETDLSTMKPGRIRAIFPGNKLCSAWINLYFIPGFTIYVKVNDGYYDIQNQAEYNFMVNAWQNKDSLEDLFGGNMSSSVLYTDSNSKKLEIALEAYRRLIDDIKEQIELAAKSSPDRRTITSLFSQLERINQKMEELINNYAKNIH